MELQSRRSVVKVGACLSVSFNQHDQYEVMQGFANVIVTKQSLQR